MQRTLNYIKAELGYRNASSNTIAEKREKHKDQGSGVESLDAERVKVMLERDTKWQEVYGGNPKRGEARSKLSTWHLSSQGTP
jgi:hypothetical protein